jgi:hypothetical protein
MVWISYSKYKPPYNLQQHVALVGQKYLIVGKFPPWPSAKNHGSLLAIKILQPP